LPYPRIDVTVKYKGGKRSQCPLIESGDAAAAVVRSICAKNTLLWREEMLMLSLCCGNRLQGWYRLGIGGMDKAICDIRIIATVAAKCASASIILAHNHPSGKLKPSSADLRTTEQVSAGMATLGIKLADHIIITDEGHISLRDEGFM